MPLHHSDKAPGEQMGNRPEEATNPNSDGDSHGGDGDGDGARRSRQRRRGGGCFRWRPSDADGGVHDGRRREQVRGQILLISDFAIGLIGSI